MVIDYTVPALHCAPITAHRQHSQGMRIAPDTFCIFADGHVEFRKYRQEGPHWTFQRVLVIEALGGPITDAVQGVDGYEAE